MPRRLGRGVLRFLILYLKAFSLCVFSLFISRPFSCSGREETELKRCLFAPQQPMSYIYIHNYKAHTLGIILPLEVKKKMVGGRFSGFPGRVFMVGCVCVWGGGGGHSNLRLRLIYIFRAFGKGAASLHSLCRGGGRKRGAHFTQLLHLATPWSLPCIKNIAHRMWLKNGSRTSWICLSLWEVI